MVSTRSAHYGDSVNGIKQRRQPVPSTTTTTTTTTTTDGQGKPQDKSNGIKIVIASICVCLACMFNSHMLELQMRGDPEAGILVTFCQFAAIAFVEGLTSGVLLFSRAWPFVRPAPRTVPIRYMFLMVSLFFVLSALNNKAFAFQIPMPLHVVFRSASLITNLILSVLVMGKRYSKNQVFSVLVVTVGIITVTLASARPEAAASPVEFDITIWATGIAILTFTSFTSAGLGLVQEHVSQKYGKSTRENLFYSHLLSLPLFFTVWWELWVPFQRLSKSAPLPYHLELGLPPLPSMWVYLLTGCFSQYLCIRSVFNLISMTSSLTLNLVITLRKFLSLLGSIALFGSLFGLTHWVGTLCVFGGSMLYVRESNLALHRKKQTEQAQRQETLLSPKTLR